MIIVFIAPMMIIPGLLAGLPLGALLGWMVRKLRGRRLGIGRGFLYALLAWLASAVLDCCFVGSLSSAQAGEMPDNTYVGLGVAICAVLVTLSLSGGFENQEIPDPPVLGPSAAE